MAGRCVAVRGWKLDAEVRAEPEAATPGLTPPLNAEEAALVEDYVRQLRAFNAEREAVGIEGLITSEDGLRELALDGIESRRQSARAVGYRRRQRARRCPCGDGI